MRCSKLPETSAKFSRYLIGMKACSGADNRTRGFSGFGHAVCLMMPKFAVLYWLSGKRGKNDSTDATAICEAMHAQRRASCP